MATYHLELHCSPIDECSQIAAMGLVRSILELHLGGSDGVLHTWREAGLSDDAVHLNLLEPSPALARWLEASGIAVATAVQTYAPCSSGIYEDMWLELTAKPV